MPHMYCIVKLNIKIAGNEYFELQEISLTDLEDLCELRARKKKQIITYSWVRGVAEFSDLFGPFALYPDQLHFT